MWSPPSTRWSWQLCKDHTSSRQTVLKHFFSACIRQKQHLLLFWANSHEKPYMTSSGCSQQSCTRAWKDSIEGTWPNWAWGLSKLPWGVLAEEQPCRFQLYMSQILLWGLVWSPSNAALVLSSPPCSLPGCGKAGQDKAEIKREAKQSMCTLYKRRGNDLFVQEEVSTVVVVEWQTGDWKGCGMSVHGETVNKALSSSAPLHCEGRHQRFLWLNCSVIPPKGFLNPRSARGKILVNIWLIVFSMLVLFSWK